MKQYLLNLKEHPGVPIATCLTVFGFLAGIEHGIQQALGGAAIMAVFWIPVLLTAMRGNDEP